MSAMKKIVLMNPESLQHRLLFILFYFILFYFILFIIINNMKNYNLKL